MSHEKEVAWGPYIYHDAGGGSEGGLGHKDSKTISMGKVKQEVETEVNEVVPWSEESNMKIIPSLLAVWILLTHTNEKKRHEACTIPGTMSTFCATSRITCVSTRTSIIG